MKGVLFLRYPGRCSTCNAKLAPGAIVGVKNNKSFSCLAHWGESPAVAYMVTQAIQRRERLMNDDCPTPYFTEDQVAPSTEPPLDGDDDDPSDEEE